jgi:hypothetical protein
MDLMGDTVAVSESKKAVSRFEELTRGSEWRLKIENVPYAALP